MSNAVAAVIRRILTATYQKENFLEEKTMAKKILAILLALTVVFAFAACGGKGDNETTTAPVETTADPFAEVEDTTAAA